MKDLQKKEHGKNIWKGFEHGKNILHKNEKVMESSENNWKTLKKYGKHDKK